MNKFTFAIDPAAQFTGARTRSPIANLRMRLFGESPARNADTTVPALRPLPVLRMDGPGNAQNAALKKQAPVPVRRFGHAEPESSKTSAQARKRLPLAYRNYLITTFQDADENWTATFARAQANGIAPIAGRSGSFMASVLAIADAQTRIDEIEAAPCMPAGMQREFQRMTVALGGTLSIVSRTGDAGCRIVELSGGGARVECENPPALFAPVMLRIDGFGAFESFAVRNPPDALCLRFAGDEAGQLRLLKDLARLVSGQSGVRYAA